ncbi:MAG: hypothetical protein K2I06_13950 [Ruminococcus sp.]|nr:hypothetical protein [Ruminococcus sp.]
MIIIKILLYIILAVLGVAVLFVILSLALPAVVKLSFTGGKFEYKVKFSLIPLMDSDGGGLLNWLRKRRKKNKKPEPDEDDDVFSYNEDFFDDESYDFTDTAEDDDEAKESPQLYEDDTEEQDENAVRTEKIKRIRDRKHHKNDDKDVDNDEDEYYVFDDEDENDDDEKESDNGKSLMDKLDFLLDVWDCGGRPLLKVFKGVHFHDVFIDFIVADEDAYKCAMNYGIVSGTVWNVLAWLGEACTVSYKTVDVRCGFSLKKSQWDASCVVKFRLHTLVTAGVWFLTTYIFKIFLPEKLKKKKEKKSAERQK